MSGTSAANILLEREGELATLDSGMEAAAAGSGSLILIEGPAGIGKSELLAAGRSRAGAADFQVLEARGGELEKNFGFGVVRQLFERPLRNVGEERRQKLLAGAASLATPALLFEGEEPASKQSAVPAGDPAASMHHGLHWLAANLAEASPLLIAVDDLHWADAVSIRWLLYLARRLSDLPILVIAATRLGEPGLDPQLLAALEGEAASAVLRPRALSEAAGAELVRLELGAETENVFAAACHRVAGGNPFLLRELIEAVRQDRIPPTSESISRIEELSPETISRSILLRLSSLPDGSEALARAVSIFAEANPRHAAALAELDVGATATATAALSAAGILAPGQPLRFTHPLIRAAVYAEIPESQRSLAHRRASEVLSDDGASAEQVAAQLLHADTGGVPGAVAILRRAASEALARSVPEASVAYLRRAFDSPDAAPLRPMLLAELVVASARAGDLTAFEGIAEDPVTEITADDEAFRSAGPTLAGWLFFNGRLDEMESVIEHAVAIYRRDGERATALLHEVGSLSVLDIQPQEAVARLESYSDRLTPGTQEEKAWYAMRGWWQHFVGGPASQSLEYVRRGLDRGQLLDVENLGPVFNQAILVLLRGDELDEAERWIQLMAEDPHQREPAYVASYLGLRAVLAYRRGDLRGAEADGRTTVDLCREQRIVFAVAVNVRWLLDTLLERGELAAAEAELEASGLAGPLPGYWWFGPLRLGRARLRIALGRPEEAIDDLRTALNMWNSTRPASDPLASTLALALHSLEQEPDEVRRLLDWEERAAREWGTPRGIGIALRAKGLVEGGETGIELLEQSVATLRPSPARLELAHSLAELGAALRRGNRRSDAREPLREAMEIAHRCAAAPLEERAREELAATGAKPRRVMLTGVESLTPSELRVARMAAKGLENRQIAQELFVSVKTVETHLVHAYQKLDISSRRKLPQALEGDSATFGG